MAYEPNPFDEEAVNPFASSEAGARAHARYAGGSFFNPHAGSLSQAKQDATVDIPLGNDKDFTKKEQELDVREAELKRREQFHLLFTIFAAIAPPVVFKGDSLAGILPAVDLFSKSTIVGIFYIVGFGCFCLEALISLWVLQQVYMYFRGSGKAAEMKRQTVN